MEKTETDIIIDGENCTIQFSDGKLAKIVFEGNPISEEEAWHTIMMRISQLK